MDLDAIFARRGQMTRTMLGATVTFQPMIRGEMRVSDDPSRTAFSARVRYDCNPGLERLGGGSFSKGDHARLAAEEKMITVPESDLVFVPVNGDRVIRMINGQPVSYDIVRSGRDGNGMMIFHLSQN
jgi:hypothetical protein